MGRIKIIAGAVTAIAVAAFVVITNALGRFSQDIHPVNNKEKYDD